MDLIVSAVLASLGAVCLLERLMDRVLSVRLREGETNVFRRKVTSVVARPCYITRVPYSFYCFYWVGGVLARYAGVRACILGCSSYSYVYLYGGVSVWQW